MGMINFRHCCVALAMTIFLVTNSFAKTTDIYPFAHPQQRQQFQQLTSELRCLVCQNESLAESNAGLAADLRAEVYERVQAGQSNQEIIRYLLARYGEYVLYKPQLTSHTAILWGAPFIFLVAGLSILLWQMRKRRGAVC